MPVERVCVGSHFMILLHEMGGNLQQQGSNQVSPLPLKEQPWQGAGGQAGQLVCTVRAQKAVLGSLPGVESPWILLVRIKLGLLPQ